MQEDRAVTSQAVTCSLPVEGDHIPLPPVCWEDLSVWSGRRRWETFPQPQLDVADVPEWIQILAAVKPVCIFWARREGCLKGLWPCSYRSGIRSPSNTQQEPLQSRISICLKKKYFHNYFLTCASLSKNAELNNWSLLFFRNRWRCPLHRTPVPALTGQLGGSAGCSISSFLLRCC